MNPIDINHLRANADPSSCAAETLFREYITGKYPIDDWCDEAAGLTSLDLSHFKLRYFPPLVPQLRVYMEERISGRIEKDKVLSQRVGEWACACRSILIDRNSDLDHIDWCIERMSAKGLSDLVNQCKKHREHLARPTVPYSDLELSNRCGALNSRV